MGPKAAAGTPHEPIGARRVVPHDVPHQRRPLRRVEQAVEVPAPSDRRHLARDLDVAAQLGIEHPDLELAQPVLVGARRAGDEAQHQRLVPLDVSVGRKNLLGRGRHPLSRRQRIAQRSGAPPAHELGAVEIGEQQRLPDQERRMGEHRHRFLLIGHLLPVLFPELRLSGHVHLGGEHPDRDQGSLPFQDGLRGREPVVAPDIVQNRVEGQVLALKGVHHFVRQDQSELKRVRPPDPEQHGRVRIVVAGHLLAVEVHQQRLELQRIRQQGEQPVGRLDPPDAGRRQLLTELRDQVCADLLPASQGGAGRALEAKAGGALDRRLEAVDQATHGDIALRSDRRAPAGEGQQQHGEREMADHPIPMVPRYQVYSAGPTK